MKRTLYSIEQTDNNWKVCQGDVMLWEVKRRNDWMGRVCTVFSDKGEIVGSAVYNECLFFKRIKFEVSLPLRDFNVDGNTFSATIRLAERSFRLRFLSNGHFAEFIFDGRYMGHIDAGKPLDWPRYFEADLPSNEVELLIAAIS